MTRKTWWSRCLLFLTAVCLLAAPGAQAASVYLFSSGYNYCDTAITAALTGKGHTVTLGVEYKDFDDEIISAYQVALLQANYNWSGYDMPAAGQTNLVNYVSSGHGLITGEWTLWKSAGSQFDTLKAVFPTTSGGSYTTDISVQYTQQTANPVINQLMPVSFTFTPTNIAGTETRLAAQTGATVFYQTDTWTGAVGLAGWTYGAGRAANFSTTMGPDEMGSADYQQLLSNTVEWAATVPLPGAVWLLGGALLGLAAWRPRR